MTVQRVDVTLALLGGGGILNVCGCGERQCDADIAFAGLQERAQFVLRQTFNLA